MSGERGVSPGLRLATTCQRPQAAPPQLTQPWGVVQRAPDGFSPH